MLQKIELSAFELDLLIRQLKNKAEGLSLDMGAALYRMREEKLYLELSHPTFESYLGSPELAMSRSTAYRLIGIYEKYVLELRIPPVGCLQVGETKLDLMRPYITEENKDELLSMGSALSKTDLREELSERFNGGKPIRPYIDWEEIADGLYKSLLEFTDAFYTGMDYRNAKRLLKRGGWE